MAEIDLSKYKRMLGAGLPRGAIENSLRRDGLDIALFDQIGGGNNNRQTAPPPPVPQKIPKSSPRATGSSRVMIRKEPANDQPKMTWKERQQLKLNKNNPPPPPPPESVVSTEKPKMTWKERQQLRLNKNNPPPPPPPESVVSTEKPKMTWRERQQLKNNPPPPPASVVEEDIVEEVEEPPVVEEPKKPDPKLYVSNNPWKVKEAKKREADSAKSTGNSTQTVRKKWRPPGAKKDEPEEPPAPVKKKWQRPKPVEETPKVEPTTLQRKRWQKPKPVEEAPKVEATTLQRKKWQKPAANPVAATKSNTNVMRASAKSVASRKSPMSEKPSPPVGSLKKSNFGGLHAMLNKALGLPDESAEPPKPSPIKVKPSIADNPKFSNMHKMLEAQFGGSGGGSKAKEKEKKKPASKTLAKKLMNKFSKAKKLKLLPPGSPEFEKYEKMKKNKLPEGAIRNCMERDGLDPEGFYNPTLPPVSAAPAATTPAPAAATPTPAAASPAPTPATQTPAQATTPAVQPVAGAAAQPQQVLPTGAIVIGPNGQQMQQQMMMVLGPNGQPMQQMVLVPVQQQMPQMMMGANGQQMAMAGNGYPTQPTALAPNGQPMQQQMGPNGQPMQQQMGSNGQPMQQQMGPNGQMMPQMQMDANGQPMQPMNMGMMNNGMQMMNNGMQPNPQNMMQPNQMGPQSQMGGYDSNGQMYPQQPSQMGPQSQMGGYDNNGQMYPQQQYYDQGMPVQSQYGPSGGYPPQLQRQPSGSDMYSQAGYPPRQNFYRSASRSQMHYPQSHQNEEFEYYAESPSKMHRMASRRQMMEMPLQEGRYREMEYERRRPQFDEKSRDTRLDFDSDYGSEYEESRSRRRPPPPSERYPRGHSFEANETEEEIAEYYGSNKSMKKSKKKPKKKGGIMSTLARRKKKDKPVAKSKRKQVREESAIETFSEVDLLSIRELRERERQDFLMDSYRSRDQPRTTEFLDDEEVDQVRMAGTWTVEWSDTYERPFYYNSQTGESKWEPPEDFL